jgi:flavin reductase (DIM6/NTAB) family NADH-FMN oxidoreductase RutF
MRMMTAPATGSVDEATVLTQRALEAFRCFLWPVTILTLADGPHVWGVTVSSFTSLSMDPPAVVFCINRDSRTAERVAEGTAVTVSLIGAGQQSLARRLSVRGSDKRLTPADLDGDSPPDRPPAIRHAIVRMDLDVARVIPAFTHHLVVAGVRDAHVAQPGVVPLSYRSGLFVAPTLSVVE